MCGRPPTVVVPPHVARITAGLEPLPSCASRTQTALPIVSHTERVFVQGGRFPESHGYLAGALRRSMQDRVDRYRDADGNCGNDGRL